MSKSSDYWKKRETEAARNTIRDEQEYNKRLNEIYEYTIANIERQVNDWYARYASKEGITMAEARGRVKHIDMERYERLAAKYVATHDFSEQANQEMALYNLTMKVNRLELLKAQINLELMAGFDDIEHEMRRDLIETAMKEDRRLAGILGDSVIGNEQYAKQLVNASFRNATFSERIWGSNMPVLRSHLEAELRNGLVQGIGSVELARRFRKHYGGSVRDTERLMTTEMCRLQTAVQKESFERNGYKEYMFITAGDERVCPDCEALHGQHFKVSEMQAGVNAPPMHPRCVLPDTKIIAPALEAITKSYYLGEVIEFTLSDGRRLTVSPNHIMLTPRGWVRAQDITKSDYVISYRRGVEPVLEGNPTDNDGVPSIEQVFTALAESQGVSTTCVPATTEDLKGDVVADTEIEIIPTDSKLWNKLDATKRKMLCDIGFVGTGKSAEIALNALGTFAKCLLTLGLASDRIVRGLSVKPLFFWRSLTCSQLISLRTPSDYNARLAETAIDSASANTKTSGERIGTFARFVKLCDQIRIKVLSSICRNTKSDAVFDKHTLDGFGFVSSDFRYLTQTFAREIQIDDIVNIRRFNYFGHVYDTSCMVTLYTANGVITSNCHCSAASYMDSDKYKRWIDALANGEDVRWDEFEAENDRPRQPEINVNQMSASEADSVGRGVIYKHWEEYRQKFLGHAAPVDFNRLDTSMYDKVNLGAYKDKETVSKILTTVNNLSSDFYSPLQGLRWMDKTESMFSRAFASTTHMWGYGSAEIRFNPVKLSEKGIERIAELSANGYAVNIPKGREVEYIVAHEFGHSILNIGEKLPTKSNNFVQCDLRAVKAARGEIEKLWDSYTADVGKASKEYEEMRKALDSKFIFEMIPPTDEERKALSALKATMESKRISAYSMSNMDEFVAEAFADVRINEQNASEHSKQVYGVLSKYFGKGGE